MPHGQQSFCPDDPGGTKEQPRRIPFCSLIFDTNRISFHLIGQVCQLTNSQLLQAAPQLKGFSMTTTTSVSRRERRKVLAATTIGTAIEWYDYFLYAAVAGLVFNKVMFGPLEGGLASIIAFLTVGISFLFRPLGAFLAGHYGDRLGRRFVLMVTLFAMGGATTLIGLLPTYDTLGYFAPLLLILLRIIQGISAGGEWGSAVLLAVEHAPKEKRG